MNVGPPLKASSQLTPARGEKLVVFCVGDGRYAIPLAAVREVLPLPLLSRSPQMPAILDGFMHLGGIAVTVVNVARLFDVPEAAPALYTPLLLLHGDSAPIALKVERVLGAVSVSESSTVRLEEHAACNECVRGAAMIDDRVVLLLSPDRILLRQQRECLAELRASEQQRIDALGEVAP